MVPYRDVQYILPVGVQFLLFASPVAYTLASVPASAQTLYELNPLTGLLEGMRWSLIGTARPSLGPGRLLAGLSPLACWWSGRWCSAGWRGSSPMSSDLAIRVDGLGKAYTIRHQQSDHVTLAQVALDRAAHPLRRNEREQFWALARRRASRCRQGEVLGLIGRNGAGKSTLLKLLDPDHRADHGPDRPLGPGGLAARGRAPASIPSSPGGRTSTSTARSSA